MTQDPKGVTTGGLQHEYDSGIMALRVDCKVTRIP